MSDNKDAVTEHCLNVFTESFDGRIWARAFVEVVRRNPAIATDEGAMIGWFSNALMRGFDEHAQRAAKEAAAMRERHAPVRERLVDEVFQVRCRITRRRYRSMSERPESRGAVPENKPERRVAPLEEAGEPARMEWSEARKYLATHALRNPHAVQLVDDGLANNPNYLHELSDAIYSALDEVDRLSRERDELQIQLSGKTFFCQNCEESGRKLDAMRPVVEAAREVSEELEAVGSPSVSAALHLRQSLDQLRITK